MNGCFMNDCNDKKIAIRGVYETADEYCERILQKVSSHHNNYEVEDFAGIIGHSLTKLLEALASNLFCAQSS